MSKAASDYLRKLQSQAYSTVGKVTIDPALRDQRLRNYGHIPGMRDVYLSNPTNESRDKAFQDAFVLPLLDQLPSDIASSLRSICVGFLPSLDFNAWAIRAPSGEPIVVVDSKTTNVLSYFAELIQATVYLADQGKNDQAGNLFTSGISCICKSVATGAEGSFPLLPDIPPDAFFYSRSLMGVNIWFILAHEFAHIQLGHLSSFSSVPLSNSYRPLNVDKYNRSQRQEFEADARAFQWMIAIAQNATDELAQFLRRFPISCLEVFTLFHYIERGLAITPTPEFSHPSAAERIQSLKQLFQDDLPPDAQSRLNNWSKWMKI